MVGAPPNLLSAAAIRLVGRIAVPETCHQHSQCRPDQATPKIRQSVPCLHDTLDARLLCRICVTAFPGPACGLRRPQLIRPTRRIASSPPRRRRTGCNRSGCRTRMQPIRLPDPDATDPVAGSGCNRSGCRIRVPARHSQFAFNRRSGVESNSGRGRHPAPVRCLLLTASTPPRALPFFHRNLRSCLGTF